VLDIVSAGDRAQGSWWRAATLEGLATGTRGRPAAAAVLAGARSTLLTLFGSGEGSVRRAALAVLRSAGPGTGASWQEALDRAERAARDAGADPALRADSIDLLALDRTRSREWLRALVSPAQPEPVQVSAVRALGQEKGAPVGRFLLERWPALPPPPATRPETCCSPTASGSGCSSTPSRSGTVQTWTLDFWQKRDLVMHRDPGARGLACAARGGSPAARGDRARYAAALDGAGSAERGREVFARACAMCHGIEGTGGTDLGPDLATVRHRPSLALLSDILLPSGSIAQSYETWLVERTNGETEAGVLASQTPSSITLRQGPGSEVTILRSEIRRMTVSPQSSMPADLDKVITPAEMADLIAFIRGERGRTLECGANAECRMRTRKSRAESVLASLAPRHAQ
jgi:putative heme-binding domain-containing protein